LAFSGKASSNQTVSPVRTGGGGVRVAGSTYLSDAMASRTDFWCDRDADVEFLEGFFLLGRGELQHRRRQQDVAVQTRVGGAVEEGVHRIEFLLVEIGIELVVVADRAAGRQAHPDACAVVAVRSTA
jgi:hypothetical protein